MGQGRAGATLSIGPDQRVYLQLALPLADLSVAGLQNAVAVLLNQAETWARRLQRV